MEILYFFIAIFATTIGAMSGMGGGIIIKPIMDAVSGLDVAIINFMSSCAVLVMAIYSIYRGRKDDVDINYRIATALAIGACLGGVFGKKVFDLLSNNPALTQSIILFILNVAIYIYLKFKTKVKTHQINGTPPSILIGFALGALSSFLGIGGGPFNVVILQYFYSSNQKVTAKRSIFIILLSQISSIITVFATGMPENVNYFAVILMMVGGCLGAAFGRKISAKLSETQMESFFTDVLVGIIVLNAFNIGQLS